MEENREVGTATEISPLPRGISCKPGEYHYGPSISWINLDIEVEYGAILPPEWHHVIEKIAEKNFTFNSQETALFEQLIRSAPSPKIDRSISMQAFLKGSLVRVRFLGPNEKKQEVSAVKYNIETIIEKLLNKAKAYKKATNANTHVLLELYGYILGISKALKDNDDLKAKIHSKMKRAIKGFVLEKTATGNDVALANLAQNFDGYQIRLETIRLEANELYDASSYKNFLQEIEQQFKELINDMLEYTQGILGEPPCAFTFLSVGPLATHMVTPYSDIRYMILINEQVDRTYFKNLGDLFELMMIGFGESPISDTTEAEIRQALSEVEYQDSQLVFRKGARLDAHQKPQEFNRLYELINTPEELIKRLSEQGKTVYQQGNHLTAALLTTSYLGKKPSMRALYEKRYLPLFESCLQTQEFYQCLLKLLTQAISECKQLGSKIKQLHLQLRRSQLQEDPKWKKEWDLEEILAHPLQLARLLAVFLKCTGEDILLRNNFFYTLLSLRENYLREVYVTWLELVEKFLPVLLDLQLKSQSTEAKVTVGQLNLLWPLEKLYSVLEAIVARVDAILQDKSELLLAGRVELVLKEAYPLRGTQSSVSSPESTHLQANKAYQHFIGTNEEENQRRYDVWYSEKSIAYLLHSTAKIIETSLRPYIFINPATQGCSFSEQFEQLMMLRNLIQHYICFIANEPSNIQVPHFICGVLTSETLLLINPIGLSKHHDFNETLAALHERYQLTVYQSINTLQKENSGLVSCGPICVELVLHLLAQVKEEWVRALRKLVKSGKGEEQADAWLHRIDIHSLLPPTLQDLNQLPEENYQQRLILIRAAHGDRLMAMNSTLPRDLSENTFWDQCENADIQVIMNQLCLGKKTIIEVQATSTYQRLMNETVLGSGTVAPCKTALKTITTHEYVANKIVPNNIPTITTEFPSLVQAASFLSPANLTDLMHINKDFAELHKSETFQRLLMELKTQHEDAIQFQFNGLHYVSRTEKLTQIYEWFMQKRGTKNKKAHLLYLSGITGSGKSVLARDIIKFLRKNIPLDAYWLGAGSVLEWKEGIEKLAILLDKTVINNSTLRPYLRAIIPHLKAAHLWTVIVIDDVNLADKKVKEEVCGLLNACQGIERLLFILTSQDALEQLIRHPLDLFSSTQFEISLSGGLETKQALVLLEAQAGIDKSLARRLLPKLSRLPIDLFYAANDIIELHNSEVTEPEEIIKYFSTESLDVHDNYHMAALEYLHPDHSEDFRERQEILRTPKTMIDKVLDRWHTLAPTAILLPIKSYSLEQVQASAIPHVIAWQVLVCCSVLSGHFLSEELIKSLAKWLLVKSGVLYKTMAGQQRQLKEILTLCRRFSLLIIKQAPSGQPVIYIMLERVQHAIWQWALRYSLGDCPNEGALKTWMGQILNTFFNQQFSATIQTLKDYWLQESLCYQLRNFPMRWFPELYISFDTAEWRERLQQVNVATGDYAYVILGQPERALKAYRNIPQRGIEIELRLLEVYLALDWRQPATALLASLRSRWASKPWFSWIMMGIYARLGETARANTLLMGFNPPPPNTWEEIVSSGIPFWLLYKLQVEWILAMKDKGLPIFFNVIKRQEDSPSTYLESAISDLAHCRIYLEQRQYLEVIALGEALTKEGGKLCHHPEVWWYLARAYAKEGGQKNREKVVFCLKCSLNYTSGLSAPMQRQRLAADLLGFGMLEEARQAIEGLFGKGVETSSLLPESYELRGLLYLKLGQVAEAYQCINKFLRQTSPGITVLMYAAWRKSLELAEYALSQDASTLNRVTPNGTTAIMLACSKGQKAIVALLLKQGATVNAIKTDHYTPLSIACLGGHADIVELLLEVKGTNIENEDKFGHRPVSAAIAGNSPSCLHLLVKKGASLKPLTIDIASYTEYLEKLFPHSNLETGLGLLLQQNKGVMTNFQTLLFHQIINKRLFIAAGRRKFGLLSFAVSLHQMNTVEYLLSIGCDPNGQQEDDIGPLFIACASGHVALIQKLLDNGARIDAKNKNGLTPLMYACIAGCGEVLASLIAKGADIDATSEWGTVLHIACLAGHLDCIKILLNTPGIKINGKNKLGITPLMIACCREDTDILEYLLKVEDIDIESEDNLGNRAITIAIQNNSLLCFRLLVQKSASLKPITLNTDLLPQILDPEQRKIYSNWFSQRGLGDIGEALCDEFYRMPRGIGKFGLLELAIGARCNLSIVEHLLALAYDTNEVDRNRRRAILVACMCGDANLLEVLIKQVNISDENGITPLIWACVHEHPKILQVLHANKANLNATISYKGINRGETILHKACDLNHLNCVQTLLDLGADPNAPDHDGLTPLMHACRAGHIDLLHVLHAKKANVNAAMTRLKARGTTALHIACRLNDLNCARTLLELGADANVIDKRGRKPLFYAQDEKVRLLMTDYTCRDTSRPSWGYIFRDLLTRFVIAYKMLIDLACFSYILEEKDEPVIIKFVKILWAFLWLSSFTQKLQLLVTKKFAQQQAATRSSKRDEFETIFLGLEEAIEKFTADEIFFRPRLIQRETSLPLVVHFPEAASTWLVQGYHLKGKAPVIITGVNSLCIGLFLERIAGKKSHTSAVQLLNELAGYLIGAAGRDNIIGELRVENGQLAISFLNKRITDAIVDLLKRERFTVLPILEDKSTPQTLAGERKRESNHFPTKKGIPSMQFTRWTRTLGDGNCAFNALALGICDLTLNNQAIDNNAFYSDLQDSLKLTTATAEAFRAWVITHPDNGTRQRLLAGIIRDFAVKTTETYYPSCRDSYQVLLWAAYLNYEKAFKEEARPSQIDNDFIVHSHIALKFQALAQEARQEEENKQRLNEWWEAEGKSAYFQGLRRPATSGSDISRWGSEIEIGMLANALKINITWEKESSSHGQQQLGIGGGLIPLDELRDHEIKQLTNSDVGAPYLNYFRIHPFMNLAGLKEKLTPLSEEEMRVAKEQLDLALERGDRKFSITSEDIKEMSLLQEKLRQRGILTLVENQYLFISLDGQEQIDKERIECYLEALPEPLCRKLESSFKANVPQFRVRHEGSHWSYCPVRASEEKSNSPTLVKNYK